METMQTILPLEEVLRQAREVLTAHGVMPRPELWQETERWSREASQSLILSAELITLRYLNLLSDLVCEACKRDLGR